MPTSIVKCTVCNEQPGAIRPLMSRERPVCDECYIAWFDSGETEPEAILRHRNALRQVRADLAGARGVSAP